MDWLGFALAVLIVEITPGPNMAWLAGLALVDGRRAGLAATAGIALGLIINGVIAAAGLAALVQADPRVFSVLRWSGAAMMLWLAYQAWRDGSSSAVAGVAEYSPETPRLRHFLSGLGINLLNPKAFLFLLVVAPQFMDGCSASFAQAMQMTAISVSIATLVHLAIVTQAARAHQWVAQPERIRVVRRVMAVLLLGVAIWFVVGTEN